MLLLPVLLRHHALALTHSVCAACQPFSCMLVSRTPCRPHLLLCCRAVYFVQGILGLARLALTYFFKDELHLDPVRHYWCLRILKPLRYASCLPRLTQPSSTFAPAHAAIRR